jgi:Zn-dependent peptidase ImmA (M78 family)
MNRGVVATLRDCVPLRPLLRTEALRIAEMQAQKILQLADIREPAVPERIIAELPRVQVVVLRPFPVSGATHWKDGKWLIVLNGGEPETRRRFSLAHEFKHILDDRFCNLIYGSVPEAERHAFQEHVCDYFAGCLLVPRPWLKRYFYGGTQDTIRLARRFDVSQAAIETRLGQTGILEPRARCSRTSLDWSLQAEDWAGNPRYRREPHRAFTSRITA